MLVDEPPAPTDGEDAQLELLREALGDDRDDEELEGLLSGEPPETALPLRWRHDAAAALEEAILRDSDNPAPYLALGRIRARQGLRGDARLAMAAKSSTVTGRRSAWSPAVAPHQRWVARLRWPT